MLIWLQKKQNNIAWGRKGAGYWDISNWWQVFPFEQMDFWMYSYRWVWKKSPKNLRINGCVGSQFSRGCLKCFSWGYLIERLLQPELFCGAIWKRCKMPAWFPDCIFGGWSPAFLNDSQDSRAGQRLIFESHLESCDQLTQMWRGSSVSHTSNWVID